MLYSIQPISVTTLIIVLISNISSYRLLEHTVLYYISVPRQEEYAIFSVLNSTICTVSEGSSGKESAC